MELEQPVHTGQKMPSYSEPCFIDMIRKIQQTRAQNQGKLGESPSICRFFSAGGGAMHPAEQHSPEHIICMFLFHCAAAFSDLCVSFAVHFGCSKHHRVLHPAIEIVSW